MSPTLRERVGDLSDELADIHDLYLSDFDVFNGGEEEAALLHMETGNLSNDAQYAVTVFREVVSLRRELDHILDLLSLTGTKTSRFVR